MSGHWQLAFRSAGWMALLAAVAVAMAAGMTIFFWYSAVSRLQPPLNVPRRAKSDCSSAPKRSWLHSIVLRSVC